MNQVEANAVLRQKQREAAELGIGGVVLFIAGYFAGPDFLIPTLASVGISNIFLTLLDWYAETLGILSIGGAIIGVWFFRPRKIVDSWNAKEEVKKWLEKP